MKFSIVTPSFNQGQFISQTIDSVINQTGDFEIEYFVMDGGSTDNTVDILKTYDQQLKNNSQIKFYWQSRTDKGQSDAINQALAKATGDIFAYLNSDDYYEPHIFKKIVDQFSKHPHQLWLIGYNQIVNEKNKPIQPLITFYKKFWLNFYNYSTLLILNYIPQPSTFFKKELFKQFGPFDESLHLCMDYDFWLKIGKKNQPIILKKSLSNFRIHSSSKGKTNYIKQFSEELTVAKKYTDNQLILLLHRIHQQLINISYFLIK